MRNASGVPHGKIVLQNGGYDGGGYVCGLDIANDGWMVERNDTAQGAIRGPTDTQWRELFKAGTGGNIANSDIAFKNPAGRTYEVCLAPSNSNIVYAIHQGFVWKSADRAVTWTKLTGYNAGVMDTGLTTSGDENARFGNHMRVSPTDPTHLGFIHPTDGKLYASTDSGTTWAVNASAGTATLNGRGGSIHFVSDTEVWVVMNGLVAKKSTTGVNGTYSTVTGGPTICSQIASGGGNVYFCGDTGQNDTQLYLWNGTAFSQPTGITGQGVAVRPTDTTKVIVFMVGGGMRVSSNTGSTWAASTGWVWQVQADDVPYLSRVNANYLALGTIRWHPTNDQLILTTGVGVFTMASPVAATSATKIVSITKGIRQMLPHDVVCTANGDVMVPVEDKVGACFTRANVLQQTSSIVPNAFTPIRHGGAMDYARDDPNYRFTVYANGPPYGGAISTDAGKTWTYTTVPTMTRWSGTASIPNDPYTGGDCAVSNAGNLLWMSTSTSGITGASTQIGAVKYSTDHGVTWSNPVWGASVDMTGMMFHHAYYLRTRRVASFKGTAGVFYVFCNGNGTASAADTAATGLWKSTNGGANFTNIRAGHFSTFSTDFYQSKLKLNQAAAGHAVWLQGATNNYPTAPSPNGLWFTNDDWVTTYTDGAFTGWSEPDDLCFGAPAPGASYQSLYCYGWRSSTYGLYACFDFNPSTRTGTWVLQETWVNGAATSDMTLAADPTVPGRVYAGISSGGLAVGDYVDTASAT